VKQNTKVLIKSNCQNYCI